MALLTERQRLSALIREGARLHPQSIGVFRRVDESGQDRTCALGAAYEALTGKLPPLPDQREKDFSIYKILLDWTTASWGVLNQAVWWNDTGVSREEIADRVERLGF